MKASAWRGGSRDNPIYGIRVGKANRDAYFNREWTAIEIEMDGQWQDFPLTPGFWNQCTEFRDSGSPRIREWLATHFSTEWPKGGPPYFALVPAGERKFRLVPNEKGA